MDDPRFLPDHFSDKKAEYRRFQPIVLRRHGLRLYTRLEYKLSWIGELHGSQFNFCESGRQLPPVLSNQIPFIIVAVLFSVETEFGTYAISSS